MTMPGRSYNAHTYRHGFTGHEKESDLAEGIYTTEYRLYDARVGRWLSVDPLFEKYVGMSPYNYCMLNPVMMVDPDGREIKIGKLSYQPGITELPDELSQYERNAILVLNTLYNKGSEKMKNVISVLSTTQERIYQIVESSITSYSDIPYGGVYDINWDSYGALQTDVIINGAPLVLSPANGLYHELGHAFVSLDAWIVGNNPNATQKEIQEKFDRYMPSDNIEAAEQYIITEYETEAAIYLEEFKPSNSTPYTRNKYNGEGIKSIKVKTPLSTSQNE